MFETRGRRIVGALGWIALMGVFGALLMTASEMMFSISNTTESMQEADRGSGLAASTGLAMMAFAFFPAKALGSRAAGWIAGAGGGVTMILALAGDLLGVLGCLLGAFILFVASVWLFVAVLRQPRDALAPTS